ncbi:hypothetical protein K7640_01925 [Micromonospora sp. PLK6-60]|uniref:hypothetical protein n=1 Tax=Micromonospora sp. PLK6-60 TaxID=2873383 RepID=UPI001CA77C98|nr:hypothetical protein [Micromonospora sp. PLK6-60]MBY8870597.1 hypothetical protein [Micromonospora sp. PLK6-60]
MPGTTRVENPSGTHPRWRVAWARHETLRRRQAYDAATADWHRRQEQLTWQRSEAAGFLGCTRPRTGLPVDLDHDEVVYRVLPVAELVEAAGRHLAGLPRPGLTVAPAGDGTTGRPLPAGIRVVDTGLAVVTDRRVAFAGAHHRREWTYAELTGPAHHPDAPLTLLPTAVGGPLAGLRVPAAAEANFRFYLTLAFAAATGRRAAVVAHLDSLLAGHRDVRPVPPPPVTPADAPVPMLRSERLAVAAAVLVVTVLAALPAGNAGPGAAEPPYRPAPGASAVATPQVSPVPQPPVVPPPAGDPATTPAGPDGGEVDAVERRPATAPHDSAATAAPGPTRTVAASQTRRTATTPATGGPAEPAASAPEPVAPATPEPTGPAPDPTAPEPTTPAPEPTSPEPSPALRLCLDPLPLPLPDPLTDPLPCPSGPPSVSR